MKLAALLMFATVPVFAVTITTNTGCTSSATGVTSTINFNGQAATDPAGYATYSGAAFDQGSNPGCGTDWLGLSGGQTTTITFSKPISYFGLFWGSPDSINTLQLFNGSTQVGSTYTGSVTGAIGSIGDYVNFFADPGEQFTQVILSSSGCCFESTDDSYILAGAVTPEPSGYFLVGLVFVGLPILRRKLRSC